MILMKTQTLFGKTMTFMVQFEKNTMGQLPANSRQFAEAVYDSMRKWHKNDSFAVLYTVPEMSATVMAVQPQNAEEVICCPEYDQWETFLTEQVVLCKKNPGRLVHSRYSSWLLIPVLAKKKCVAALLVARRGKKLGEEELDAGRLVSQYLTTVLKRIRKTNKRFRTYGEELRHRTLLDAQSSVNGHCAGIPGSARIFDYQAGTGSDFSLSTLQDEGRWLCCTGDITASESERQQAFVYIDTIFHFLAKTPLDALQILMRINETLVNRSSECYVSTVVARYLPGERCVEIAGSGNSGVLYFSHEDMSAKEYSFGAATGVDGNAEFSLSRIPVQTGDIVCIYTDGVRDTKKRNGYLFGKTDLAETVRRNYFLGAEELSRKIMDVLREKEDPLVNKDDRTIQILKIEQEGVWKSS